MDINNRAILAQKDNSIREELIKEYSNFIKSRTSDVIKTSVTSSDDSYSVGLEAFDEAISNYDEEKGNFLNYSSIVIKNRLINYMKSEARYSNVVPFSSLETQDEDGNNIPFDVEDEKSTTNDVVYEIESLKQELQEYNISFFDLPKDSPKSGKTKEKCKEVIRYIVDNPILLNQIKEKKTLPSSIIMKQLKVNDKLLERHRKYIIATVIILVNDYEEIKSYINL